MQVLLATSPDVHSLPETGMLRRGIIGDVLLRDDDRPPTHTQYERIGLISSPERRVDRRVLIDTYIRAVGPETQVGTDSGHSLILDKDPRLIEWLPVVTDLFRDAKIVLLVRDPRAVTASKQRARWSAGRSSFRMQLEAEIQATLALEYLAGTDRDRVLLVPFTKLVTSPLNTVNSVLEWLGRPKMGSIDVNDRIRIASGLVTAEEMQWKGRVFEPVEPKRAHAWTQHLPESDKLLVDHLARSQFQLCRLAGEQLSADISNAHGWGVSVLQAVHRVGVWGVTTLRQYQHRRIHRQLESSSLDLKSRFD